MTAYVVNQHDENVYSLNLLNGTHTLVTALPIPATQLSDIALMNDTAYVVAYENSDIYAVSLLNGMSSTISTTIPSSLGITGIALLNNIAYVTTVNQVGIGQGGVYTVDVTTGQASLLTPSSAFPDDAEAFDIAIVDGKIAYTAGGNDNNVYAINLATGALSLVTPVPVPGAMPNGGLFGLGVLLLPPPPPPPPPLPPMVHTLGLSGNLLIFANYLNAQAPLSTLSLFDPLSGSALTEALEASMPARLGFATFAAQNGYFASAQVVTDHLYQKRFINRKSNNSQIAAMNLSEHDLLVNASKKICSPADAKSQASCNKQGFFTGWLGSFGEYAHEKAQQQTPAFDAAVGGAVVGMDYNCINNNVIGFGGSYAYTHVHEEQGMGHANVNQGFLGLYSTLHMAKWYFDIGAWGGYYQTHNHRTISFPGFHKIAQSSTHGWQVAPHFELGYDGYFSNVCNVKWFGVGPFLLADWVGSWEHAFSEHGAGALNMHQKEKFSSFFRGETGLRFHEIITYRWGNLVLQEKGSYVYQKMFHTGAVTAFLVGSPSSFTVNTLTGAQNLGVAEFSILFKPSKTQIPYVNIRYQGEFGSRYQSHQAILEIGKDF